MVRKQQEGAEVNMTPMIDVVFQLIIFFVVTLRMTKEINEKIKLEDGKHGETITAENTAMQSLTIEVDRRRSFIYGGKRGRISINNAQLTDSRLKDIIKSRYQKFGSFPVLIRADKKAVHEDVKRVMDICTSCGVWKIGLIAIQEKKTQD